MTRRLAPLVLTLMLAFGVSGLCLSSARPVAAAQLSASDRALVDKAARYLEALKSAEATFSQIDPRGAVTTGRFFLQRPGKARFAYDPPAELTVVADGLNVEVYDGKLKTFDQYPLKQTPLALLLGREVKFGAEVVVAAVSETRTGFGVAVRDANHQAQGQLLLSFNKTPLALAGWTVLDAEGGKTSVTLSGLKSGIALSPGLFVLRDPEPHTIRP